MVFLVIQAHLLLLGAAADAGHDAHDQRASVKTSLLILTRSIGFFTLRHIATNRDFARSTAVNESSNDSSRKETKELQERVPCGFRRLLIQDHIVGHVTPSVLYGSTQEIEKPCGTKVTQGKRKESMANATTDRYSSG